MKSRAALALVLALSAIAGVSSGVASAKPSAAHRCRHLATTQNAGLLALCLTIVGYVEGRQKWDPAAARLKAQYGTDPVKVVAAGRVAWVKLAGEVVKLEQPVTKVCPKASALGAYFTSQKDASALVLMCKTALNALTVYRGYYATFSQHRRAKATEAEQVRKALADFARNQSQVAAVLSDEPLVG